MHLRTESETVNSPEDEKLKRDPVEFVEDGGAQGAAGTELNDEFTTPEPNGKV